MVNSIAKINTRLDYTWIDKIYTANILNDKVVYKVEDEYKAVEFDSGVVYHRLIGKPSLNRVTNRESIFSYPMRTVFVVKVPECDNPEVLLANVAQSAVGEVDSMELRMDTVTSDEGIQVKEGYTAIYVDYTFLEGVSNYVNRNMTVNSGIGYMTIGSTFIVS